MNDQASIFEERRGEGFCYAEETNDVLKNIRPRLPGSCWIRYTMNYGAEEISMPSCQFRGVLWAGGGCVILEAADRGASSLTSANVPPTSAIDIAPHDRVRQESCSCFSG